MADADLLQRYVPYLRYDSLESFRADSAATLAEHFFDDGSNWSYANSLKRAGGSVIAAVKPKQGQKKLDLAFLGRRYAGGAEARKTDFLDAPGRRYVEDARRLHTDPRYADRVYGHVARDANRTIWLQYWFFYYYNDKNFLGIGLHEGDWEMIQLRLGANGRPNAATFAQHNTGQAFAWSDLELRSSPDGEVPVVYVGRGSHASFARAGEHWPMFPLPPDYADGKGELLRPKLEVISDEPGWVLWPGKWGSSDSSPDGPSQKARWGAPAAYHAEIGAEATRTRARRGRAGPERAAPPAPPRPDLSVQRVEDRVMVTYRFPERLRASVARPERLAVSVDSPDDDLPPATQAFTVRTAAGVVAHSLPLEDKRYVVRAVAYSPDGVESKVVTAKLGPGD
jgi:Vacuolar protein sorting-associated protein 62